MTKARPSRTPNPAGKKENHPRVMLKPQAPAIIKAWVRVNSAKLSAMRTMKTSYRVA
jgi:hypothetical protein